MPQLAPIIQNGGEKDEIIAKADSGASQHYFRPEDSVCLRKIHTDIGPPVTLPLGDSVNSNQAGHLPINGLPNHATKTRIIQGLKSASLISLGQLTDGGCMVELNSEKLNVTRHGKTILKGVRNKKDLLYNIPISTEKKNPYDINNINMQCLKSCIKVQKDNDKK